MRQKTFALVALVVVVVGAGCGGTPRSAVKSTRTTRSKAVRFSECMRANGVRGFPDPDASGALTSDSVANGSSVDTSSSAFQQAVRACKDLEPSGFAGHERSSQEQAAAVEFAHCMRNNGVTDFPDPAKSDPLVDTTRIPSSNTPGGMTVLNAAMHACQQDASAAGVRGSR